jgi:hypothetical protein
MACRPSLLLFYCCSLLATALAACESDDAATRFADFTEPLLEKYTNLEICMKTCEACQDVASCSQYCNENISDATPACEDKLALWYLAVNGDVFVNGQCRTAPIEYEFIIKKTEELVACMDAHGCLRLEDRQYPCAPVYDGGSTTCGCAKECKGGTVYRTDCPKTSGTMIDCECFVNDVSVGTCQQGFLEQCDQWNGCCHQYFPPLPQ